jgi:hypothetical protein
MESPRCAGSNPGRGTFPRPATRTVSSAFNNHYTLEPVAKPTTKGTKGTGFFTKKCVLEYTDGITFWRRVAASLPLIYRVLSCTLCTENG